MLTRLKGPRSSVNIVNVQYTENLRAFEIDCHPHTSTHALKSCDLYFLLWVLWDFPHLPADAPTLESMLLFLCECVLVVSADLETLPLIASPLWTQTWSQWKPAHMKAPLKRILMFPNLIKRCCFLFSLFYFFFILVNTQRSDYTILCTTC
jgi:hypothetical protein